MSKETFHFLLYKIEKETHGKLFILPKHSTFTYIGKKGAALEHLPKRYLHKLWEAPSEVLKEACIELGKDYPHPIDDHKEARERALQRYDAVKSS
ncbi:FAD-binding domain-containing protein [Priestia filamentosa]|uniref:FAD-binding domain-containing protein n=1 Tax=Priestia filamentosa TaxID=1402861 RepID=UPI0039785EEF